MPAQIASLYEVPLLTPQEERQLFFRYNYCKFRAARLQSQIRDNTPTSKQLARLESWLNRAERAKERLIRANMRLVVALAKRFADSNNCMEDLVSDGNLSLMRAVEKFNFALGHRFSTYATHAIQRSYFRTAHRQRQRQGRFIADENSLRAVQAAGPSQQLGEREVGGLRCSFDRMFTQLDERERHVVRERFGFNESPPKTFKELGETLGVCKERVRQIQARAMLKLRKLAEREHLSFIIDDAH